MRVKEFVSLWSHNNLVRLVYRVPGGHKLVLAEWTQVDMDWNIAKESGIFAAWSNHQVIGLASIGVPNNLYPEAINIIIENLEIEEQQEIYTFNDIGE